MPIEAVKGSDGKKTNELYQLMLKMMEQSGAEGTNTEKVLGEMAQILADAGLKISLGTEKTASGAAEKSGLRSIGGGPDLKTSGNSKKTTTEALEKLIALLQMENLDEQIKLAKKRIQTSQAEISARHDEQAKKIDEGIQKAKEAEKQRRRRKIFGWLFAAFAAIAAVVVSVATGGVATGAVIGAVVAVGSAVATQFDALEKLQKAIEDGLVKMGVSREKAMIASAAIMVVASIALAVAMAALSGGAGAGEIKEGFVTAMRVLKGVSIAMGAISSGQSLNSTITNWAASNAQIDSTLLAKILAQLQQRMDDESEELKKLIDLMQDAVTGLASLIEKDSSAMDEIALKLGAMGV